jgi:DNA mismatch repair protein MutL
MSLDEIQLEGAKRPRIAVLPRVLADQIAAGEVIERPASVVKELCENSLDAGASRILVSIADGGKKHIEVSDDGHGMSGTDAELALKSHATSKLHALADLDRVSTLGFRGEALPSIASVSKLTILTRPADADAGTQVTVSGGSAADVRVAGCASGTTVMVDDLFYNIPARRKFLKRTKTETGHIGEALLRLALVHPEVRFELTVDGKPTLSLDRHAGHLARAQQALQRRAKGELYEHDCRTENGVHAIIAPPAAAVSSARWCYFFVNKRYVRDRMLLKTVTNAFRETLPKGRYPVGVFLIHTPPEEVDVNVHPQKLEVRFGQQRKVASALYHAVAELVAKAPWSAPSRVYRLSTGAATHSESAPSPGGERLSPREASTPPLHENAIADAANAHDGSGLHNASHPYRTRAREAVERYAARTLPRTTPATNVGANHPAKPRHTPSRPPHPAGIDRLAAPVGPPPATDAVDTEAPRPWFEKNRAARQTDLGGSQAGAEKTHDALTELRYVGQALGTFLLFEGQNELIVIDQHAAHERLRYNEIRQQLEAQGVESQRLLVSVRLELSAAEMDLLITLNEELVRLGFEVEAFGTNTAALKAVPAFLADSKTTSPDPATVLRDLLAELDELPPRPNGETGATQLDALRNQMAATLACHSAVRAGQAMDRAEVDALLAAMETARHDAPWDHCPHGRPVLIRISRSELFGRFDRT